MKQQRYLFIMLGFVGSGKSFVSRWLAPLSDAVYLRADALRIRMFGEDRLELYTPTNKALVNNAQAYAVEQILQSGSTNVVHDANNNARKTRRNFEHLADKYGARAIVVWVDTPLEVAEERAEIRKTTEGHELFEPNVVRKLAARLEHPTEDETVIRLDGSASAEAQQQSFRQQFAQLTGHDIVTREKL